jgi:HAD superfamily hydrolase (TIGR01484 family)
MNKYKLVIADVDGTILPPSQRPSEKPTERLINAVKELHKMGLHFSLATARSLPWIQEIISALSLTGPIILDNGARIYNLREKRYIREYFLPQKEAESVLGIFKKDPVLNIFLTDTSGRIENPQDTGSRKIVKMMALGMTPEKADKLYQQLKKIPDIQVTKSISGDNPVLYSVHVTSPEANKQEAVLEVARYYNIDRQEIIGIGDSYNDYPLLMACGLKVAMGNAVPEIKAVADYIAPPYNEDGVAVTIEKYILNM